MPSICIMTAAYYWSCRGAVPVCLPLTNGSIDGFRPVFIGEVDDLLLGQILIKQASKCLSSLCT